MLAEGGGEDWAGRKIEPQEGGMGYVGGVTGVDGGRYVLEELHQQQSELYIAPRVAE